MGYRASAREPAACDRRRYIGLTAELHAIAPDRFARFAAEAAAAETFHRSHHYADKTMSETPRHDWEGERQVLDEMMAPTSRSEAA